MISVFDKVAATICLLIGLVIGILMTHGFYVAELADARTTIKSLELQRSTDIASTNAAALNRIQKANARSDALQTELDITAQRLTITQSEMQREIHRTRLAALVLISALSACSTTVPPKEVQLQACPRPSASLLRPVEPLPAIPTSKTKQPPTLTSQAGQTSSSPNTAPVKPGSTH